eukprot:Gb_07266 [translate_table: standard]
MQRVPPHPKKQRQEATCADNVEIHTSTATYPRGLQMLPKGQELAKKPESRVERIARWQKEKNQAGEGCLGPWSPRRNIHAEHSKKARRANPTSKTRYERTHPFKMSEMEKCQLEAMPSRASPDLTCESHILSNIMHEPVEASTQRDSHGIPQTSTEESPQGTDQSNTWQTPVPTERATGDPFVFYISTNSIKKLTKRLLGSDPKRLPNESPVTFRTNSRSFKQILEFVINDLLKITLRKRRQTTPMHSKGRDIHK